MNKCSVIQKVLTQEIMCVPESTLLILLCKISIIIILTEREDSNCCLLSSEGALARRQWAREGDQAKLSGCWLGSLCRSEGSCALLVKAASADAQRVKLWRSSHFTAARHCLHSRKLALLLLGSKSEETGWLLGLGKHNGKVVLSLLNSHEELICAYVPRLCFSLGGFFVVFFVLARSVQQPTSC